MSLNWAGKSLHSLELMTRYIANATRTGLTVTAALKRGDNELGERVTDDGMQRLKLARIASARNETTRCSHALGMRAAVKTGISF